MKGCVCRKHGAHSYALKGADNPNWHGDQVTYHGLHQRIAAIRGVASLRENRVRISMNGPAVFTSEEWGELYAAVAEATGVLTA